MEFELDKEMDSLLRHEARRGLFVAENTGAHLDADEISAFAENALPLMARSRATEHLADCDRCRATLANLIKLNSEPVSETIHTESGRVVQATLEEPWFKRLLAFPKLTFAMTAMMLLMTGAIAFIALRSLNEQGSTVAQLEPKEEKSKEMDSVASNTSVELKDQSNNNSPAANAPAANASANSSAPAANTAAIPDSGEMARKNEDQSLQPSQKGGPSGTPGDTDLPYAKDKATIPGGNPVTTDGILKQEPAPAVKPVTEAEEKLQENKPQNRDNNYGNIYQNQSQDRNMSPDTQNSKRTPQPPPAAIARSQSEVKEDDERGRKDASGEGGERSAPKAAKKKEAPETRNVGGKTFRNLNGIWTDTSYSGGGATSVKRGSDEYKKLDSGLQSIGNSFGGTVIVVWGGRAYRIQ